MNNNIVTTKLHLKAAFTEWDRRYRANPEEFRNEAARLLDSSQDEYTYGEAATPYFMQILEDVSQ